MPVKTWPQQMHVASGRIVCVESFDSKYIPSRNIYIWLPDGYTNEKLYPVVYMHDGQMLFDSTQTWNQQEWGVDETAGRLISEHKIRECLVVGIPHAGPFRFSEYFPQKPFESLTEEEKTLVMNSERSNSEKVFNEKIYSGNYLQFLVQELKPFIDSSFSTHTDRENTFVMGSSMGGLISLYAICEYPEVYGGAACFSTHWPGIFTLENNPFPAAIMDYLKTNLPGPQTHKLYFDHGTETLDAMYPALQKQVDRILEQKGYTGEQWITLEFKGEGHDENAWSRRLELPLQFFLQTN